VSKLSGFAKVEALAGKHGWEVGYLRCFFRRGNVEVGLGIRGNTIRFASLKINGEFVERLDHRSAGKQKAVEAWLSAPEEGVVDGMGQVHVSREAMAASNPGAAHYEGECSALAYCAYCESEEGVK
jgi:hypothetical protein